LVLQFALYHGLLLEFLFLGFLFTVPNGLNFSFKCPTLESENTVTKQQYIKWNNEKKTEFIEHMSVNETDSIRNIEVMIDEYILLHL
jgi:hypothetical protein